MSASPIPVSSSRRTVSNRATEPSLPTGIRTRASSSSTPGVARAHAGERFHHATEVRAVLDVQLHDLAADLVLQLVGCSQGDHGADVDHGDPVRELIGLFEVLGREHQRGAFVLQLADEVPHVDPAPRVEARRRLVEEQDLRTPHQARGQVQPSAHAAGVRLRRSSRGIHQLEPLQDLLGAAARLRLREVVEPSDELEVLEPGEVLVDRRALSREADPEPQLLGVAHGVQPVDLRSAAGGREQGGQDPDRRSSCRLRSARAARTRCRSRPRGRSL